MPKQDKITVALAQLKPVWLNREKTIDKVVHYINQAAAKNADLVVFGEAFVPGYPFWLERTGAAAFNNEIQKTIHAHYLDQAVRITAGDLDAVCAMCKKGQIATILGTIELAKDRGNHSVYCALVYIDKNGTIANVHRKLMPTYEERLSWAMGDGHGLRTHELGAFTVGALNCWENWMPLARAALYAQGENLHVAIWPGAYRNTEDLTRFIAKESRSYVISVSGLLHADDISPEIPYYDLIAENSEGFLADGGSCLAAPDGSWTIEPVVEKEALLIAEIDHAFVRAERQNFDPSGHYSRPDVLQLKLNRGRQSVLEVT